jgi:hypothetical protein
MSFGMAEAPPDDGWALIARHRLAASKSDIFGTACTLGFIGFLVHALVSMPGTDTPTQTVESEVLGVAVLAACGLAAVLGVRALVRAARGEAAMVVDADGIRFAPDLLGRAGQSVPWSQVAGLRLYQDPSRDERTPMAEVVRTDGTSARQHLTGVVFEFDLRQLAATLRRFAPRAELSIEDRFPRDLLGATTPLPGRRAKPPPSAGRRLNPGRASPTAGRNASRASARRVARRRSSGRSR